MSKTPAIIRYELLSLFLLLTAVANLQAAGNRYIVRLKDTADPKSVAERFQSSTKGEIGTIYTHAIKGFTVTLPNEIARSKANIPMFLKGLDPDIVTVEKDLPIRLHAQTLPTGLDRMEIDLNGTAKIDGITENVDVDVAVIDTGVQPDHPDLNVYASGSRSFATRSPNDWYDEKGHGTSVAGIIGAVDNNIGTVGIAPGARIWALRVFRPDGTGYVADTIEAIDYVTGKADQIEVVNISLGSVGIISAYQEAIVNSINQGVVYVVSAGNEDTDIYGPDHTLLTEDDTIPAAYPEVLTVSAMVDKDGIPGGFGSYSWAGYDDSFANFSNYSNSVVSSNPVQSPGAAIDLVAPGVDIYTTRMNSSYGLFHGTSASAPHVAGLVANYIALNGRAYDANGVNHIRQQLINGAVQQNDSRGFDKLNDPDGHYEPIASYIRGDFDYSGTVDATDLAMLTAYWLAADKFTDIAPLGGNGVVDAADLALLADLWNK